MRFLYGLTIALSAFLLFSVEPMVARTLLPQMGGSSAVWLGSLAFFQVALLAGYAYAVLVAPASRVRPALPWTHLGLLGLALLCLVHPMPSPGAGTLIGSPQVHLFALLGAMIGLPFVLLSTTAPLLQSWCARREDTAVPYRLYGLSNLASLLALLLYPLAIEPYLLLRTQWLLWRWAFAGYAALAGLLTLRMRSARPVPFEPGTAVPQTLWSRRLLWVALPAVASAQLAAVTGHLIEDLAALPLLWVVPLGAYLLSFVLAFEFPQLYRRGPLLRLLAVLLFALGYFLAEVGVNVPIGLSIVLFTAELFCAAWVCHAELFGRRPTGARESPVFYLCLAAGAAAGTVAVVVLSPLVTDSNLDLPIAFLLTAALMAGIAWQLGRGWRALWGAGTALGIYLLLTLQATYAHDSLLRARNFYGSLRVKQTQLPPQAFLNRTLYNGNIQHGMQWFSTAFHRTPLTYYAPDSGVGLTLDHCCAPSQPRRIGVIGLGAGTLAAYGRQGDALRFYEINPLVTDVASHLFTFTRDTPARVAVVPGDARLTLATEPPQRFDVLVVDAFSGDSIPVHLLTREALQLYRRHLAPGGVLAFHISNQYLDLAPVLARLAESTRKDGSAPMTAREIDSAADEERGEALASWVLFTDRPSFFAQTALTKAHPIATDRRVPLWVDQRSSLLPILRWGGRRTP